MFMQKISPQRDATPRKSGKMHEHQPTTNVSVPTLKKLFSRNKTAPAPITPPATTTPTTPTANANAVAVATVVPKKPKKLVHKKAAAAAAVPGTARPTTTKNASTLLRKDSVMQRRQTIIYRTDNVCRRNTIWSDTVSGDLLANLSNTELNRQEVLFEIIKTEAEYVRDLRLIEEVFINPIKQEEERLGKQIVPDHLNKVFNSISYFRFIHEVISNCLNERQESQFPLVRSISDILFGYVWVFRAYAPYLIHYEDALRELEESLRRKSKLGRLVRKQQKLPACRNLPLTTYLLKAFQRLLKYPLLIQKLLKYTERESCDYEKTHALKTKLDSVLQNVEEQKRAHENMLRLQNLESRITGLGGFRLAIDNRQLLREEPACKSLQSVTSLRKSSISAVSSNKRHSVRNLYTLECNDIVLLVEKTGITRDNQLIYKLVSPPPSPSGDESTMHKHADSGVYYD